MPLKIPYYEMDIPRLVTALADWLACLLYLRFLPPRYGGVKRAALHDGDRGKIGGGQVFSRKQGLPCESGTR